MEFIDKFVKTLFQEIFNPIIFLLSACFFVYFLWGVIKFIKARIDGKEDEVKAGKNHLLWGLIGLVLIFSAVGIYKGIISIFN